MDFISMILTWEAEFWGVAMPNGSDKVSQQIAKRLNESARLKEEIARKNAGECGAIEAKGLTFWGWGDEDVL